MADTVEDRLTPKEAINAAFDIFRDFFGNYSTENTLLEGLEYLEENNVWRVSISFDIGRTKKIGSIVSMFEQSLVPIREIRHFEIEAKTGNLVRMTGD